MRRFLMSRHGLFWIVAGLLLGGIVHILAVLTAQWTASDTAMQKIVEIAPLNAAMVLAPARPETQLYAYMAPDVRYVVCRFDISKDPLSVRTPLLEGTWSIALYDELGRNFYTITGADLQRREAELILAPSENGSSALPFGRDAPTTAITVSVPAATGLVMIRAPSGLPALNREIEAALAQVRCQSKSARREG